MNTLRGQVEVQAGEYNLDALLNMNCFRILCQDQNMELAELDELANANALEFVPAVLWAGIKNAAIFHGKDMPEGLGFERFAALLLADPDAITHYANAISDSMGFGVEEDNAGK
jgi:hypothetical protein